MFADDELKDFDFEELDNEIGLGELLKQKDNFFVSLIKKIIFAVLVILIGIMVFYASFTIGKVLFLSDSPTINPSEEAISYNDIVADNKAATENASTQTANVVPTEVIPAPVVKEKPVAIPVKKEEVKPIAVIAKEAVKALPVQKPVQVAPVVQNNQATQYALIAGTFGQMANAKNLESTLVKKGYKVEIKPIPKNGTTFYRVIAATVNSLEAANSTKKALLSNGIEVFVETVKN